MTALTQGHPQVFSAGELEAIYIRLPLRNPRPVFLSDENVLAELPSEDSAEERVRAGEREIALRSAAAVLDCAGIDHAAVGELMDRPALDLSLEPRPERTSTPQSARGRKADGSNGARR